MDQFRSVRGAVPLSAMSSRALSRLLRTAVPASADFASVHVVSGRVLVCVTAVHQRPDDARALRALLRRDRISRLDPESVVARVTRTGQHVLRSEIHAPDAATTRHSVSSGIVDFHRRFNPRSVLVVPLLTDARVVGAVTLCYSQSGRRYTSADVAAARLLARSITNHLGAAPPVVELSSLGSRRHGTLVRRRTSARG